LVLCGVSLPTTALAFSPSHLQTEGSPRWLLSVSADKSVALIELRSGGQSRAKRNALILLLVTLLVLALAVALGKEPWKHALQQHEEL